MYQSGLRGQQRLDDGFREFRLDCQDEVGAMAAEHQLIQCSAARRAAMQLGRERLRNLSHLKAVGEQARDIEERCLARTVRPYQHAVVREIRLQQFQAAIPRGFDPRDHEPGSGLARRNAR